MVKIQIILDQDETWQPDGAAALTVRTEADYLAARRAIRDLGAGDLTVLVRNAGLACRFDDLRREPGVEILRFDARRQLADLLGRPLAEIPEVLSAPEVARAGLLSCAATHEIGASEPVADWALRVLFGDPWGRPQVRSADIIKALLGMMRSATPGPGVAALIQAQVLRWSTAGAWRSGWQWLKEDLFLRARCLLFCLAVAGYEDLRLAWLVQEGFPVDLVKAALDSISSLRPFTAGVGLDKLVSARLQELVRAEIRSALSTGGIPALSRAVARLSVETDALEAHLYDRASRQAPLSPREVEAVREWARPLGVVDAATRLATLAGLLEETEKPQAFPESSEWADIREWLFRSYMPAYVSRAASDRAGEMVTECRAFESWLLENYHHLHLHSNVGVHHFLQDVAGKTRQGAVLILVLDGVPYHALRRLADQLRDVGLCFVTDERTYLALLPSVTSANKPGILLGRLPDERRPADADNVAEAHGLNQGLVTSWVTKDPSSIAPVLLQTGHLGIVHFQAVDQELLHRPMASLRRWWECLRLMDLLALEIRDVFQRAKDQEVALWVGCVSDHGWTEIPAEGEQTAIPGEYTEQVEHSRVLRGLAAPEYGWPLEAGDFYLEEPATIARTFDYYGSRPRSAVHGGATPQETVTSGFWLSNVASIRAQNLILQVEGTVARRSPENQVRLTLVNPNPASIEVSALTVAGMDTPDFRSPFTVEEGSLYSMTAVIDASTTTGPSMELCGTITWNAGDHQHIQGVHLVIATKGPAESAESFESMFSV